MNPTENMTDLQGYAPRLSRYQRYTIERIPRGQLRNASYNPRKITPDAKERLKGVLAQQGLLEAIVWNRSTGNLVGGHQRLACLDALEGTPDYALDVCVVDLDDKQEREANAALNNPSIQGVFDAELFDDFMKAGDFDFAKAGFTEMELGAFLSDRPLASNGDVQAGLKQLGVIGPVTRLEAQPSPVPGPRQDDEPDDDAEGEGADDEGDGFDDDDTERPAAGQHYAVVVFRTAEERLEFYQTMGIAPGQHVPGGELMAMIGDD